MERRREAIRLLELIGREGDDQLASPGAVARRADEAGFEPAAVESLSLHVSDLRRLRDALEPLLAAVVGGIEPPPGSVASLNEISAGMPVVLELVGSSDGAAAIERPLGAGRSGAGEVASLARAAVRLLGGPDRERLHRCPRCGRFFLAERATQVWCSAACGNRARVARHHARRRSDRPARERA